MRDESVWCKLVQWFLREGKNILTSIRESLKKTENMQLNSFYLFIYHERKTLFSFLCDLL